LNLRLGIATLDLMSETVSGALIVATFLLLTAAVYSFLMGEWSDHSILFNQAVLRQEQQVETSLDIASIGLTNCPDYAGPYNATVENTGNTSFDDFSKMDVLVDYTDAADNKVATRLQHGSDWSISSIAPDDRDPNLWNSAETATVTFTLASALKPETSGVFIIVAPQGVSDSAYFACPNDECDGETGFLGPAAEAADTGGNGDGFESSPANAFADDNDSAANDTQTLSGDRHRFYNYGFSIASGCVIQGIEVRLDWRLLDTAGNNSIDVELSWDGGTSWTAARTDSVETTTEHTAILGGSADTWGRAWSPADFSDANFRVRLTTNNTAAQTFNLDWVAVNVYYAPP
jgi:archaellum component FlaF (FlaF/FlaG flagellin family)